jgi:heme-degrading monooxygenase HmoA
VFIQLFEGWRYRPGVRDRLAGLGLGAAAGDAPRPDVPGLIARLLATEVEDPDTGIGLWVWENEAACRAYEASRPPEMMARLETELNESALRERTFDALLFGARIPPSAVSGP